MLDEDDTPVIMDFGSMGEAKIEVNGMSQARALQVINWLIKYVLWNSFGWVIFPNSMSIFSAFKF